MERPTGTPKPFDTTTKDLVAFRPADWLRYLGLRQGCWKEYER